jgi:hypothetical protein
MMVHSYTEDQLVAQSAIGLFAELAWEMVSAMERNQWDRACSVYIHFSAHLASTASDLELEKKGVRFEMARFRAHRIGASSARPGAHGTRVPHAVWRFRQTL